MLKSRFAIQQLKGTYRVTDFGGNYYNCNNLKSANKLVELLNQEVDTHNKKEGK